MAADKTAPTQAKVEVGPDAPYSGETQMGLRNDYYRDSYKRLVLLAIVLSGIIAGAIGFCFFIYAMRPAPQYFATTAAGNLIKLAPLSAPNLATEALLSWASQSATAAFTYNFVDYKAALERNRINFTTRGYQNFLKALQDAKTLDSIAEKKLVVSAVPTGTPVILQEGLVGEYYAWRLQLPMLISYQSASDTFKQNVVITMLVTRVPTLESEKGVGISQFIVTAG